LEIDISNLLRFVPALLTSGARIGWPDDPTPVDIADPTSFVICLDNALRAFRDLRGGADYLVSAKVNGCHLCVTFMQRGGCEEGWQKRVHKVEPALKAVFRDLHAAAARSGGRFSHWGGTNFCSLSFPFQGPVREEFPDVQHLPWDEQYRQLLHRAAWTSLRSMVFRFSNLAEQFAARCVEFGLSSVLIPSVGLCVHPWLFADHGLSVTATDAARPALSVLSEPNRWPRLYSRPAFERWDLAESALYATQGNPDPFARMPDLLDRGVREALRQRITFAVADWADLPVDSGSVDAIFATNALPRESAADQARVPEEWARVVKPGGAVFIAQHNFSDADVERIERSLRSAGWAQANILGGDRPAQPGTTAVQMRYSSG
jgi:hypothetical protein